MTDPSSPSINSRILIVDDGATIRMFVRQALEQAGFVVEEAENGRQALELFARTCPDLVLLDVIMPEMDGFRTCAALRQTARGEHLPIVMLTGLEDEASIDRAYEVGATDFITKPINWVLLGHRVRYLLRASQAIAEVRQSEEALRQEVHLSTTLVQVGRDLTSSLATPVILERLCQLTTAVLSCERSYTLLYQPERDTYAAVASYGYLPHQKEMIKTLSLSGATVAPFVKRLVHTGLISQETSEGAENIPSILLEPFALNSGLFLALQRGSEVIGIHTIGSQAFRITFSPQQQRLALGIAQFASLALDNACLLEQAESATRLKSDFLSTVSHELRTPLHIILGYNDLLLEQTFGPLTAQQSSTLLQLQRSAKELLGMIDNVLQVGRLEANKLPVELQEFDVPAFITQLQTETSDLCEQSELQFEWQIEEELPILFTDVGKLKMVIKNLIGNAVKFTPEGIVTITARAQRNGVEIGVSDTGPGIPREDLHAIFDAFRQGGHVLTRQHRGVGLGLYIVRQMLDLLGGSISVESTVGKGSTFCIWVPQRRSTTQPSLFVTNSQPHHQHAM
jgi:signal transduction histidine kinase/DNA-binding response OmpR family regulator